MINARGKGQAAEILSAQVICWRIRQSGEGGVGSGKVGMSLCRYGVPRVKGTVGDDAGWESSYGSARAYADVTGNLSETAIRYR